MHPSLTEALELYRKFHEQLDRGIVGLDDPKEKTLIAFFSEVPTSYTTEKSRRVNAGLVWFMGVPGVGKTYFGVVLAACTNTQFGRIQGRADLLPGDVVGMEYYNLKTGEWEQTKGPIITANILLLDEMNRIPPKAQSAFLEANQDHQVTIGNTTYFLPEFYFAIATTNPVETTEGTYTISAASADRFSMLVYVGYLPVEKERELVRFDFKNVMIEPIVDWRKVVELRSAISEQVFMHPDLDDYITRLVAASRPLKTRRGIHAKPAPEIVEQYVDIGCSPRVTIAWGSAAKVRALFVGKRDQVYPEDIQALMWNFFAHRLSLNGSAYGDGITVDMIVNEILRKVPIP